jgi:hypothetical protein
VLDWSLKFKFFDLKKITVFVLDEADVMIATQGHQVRLGSLTVESFSFLIWQVNDNSEWQGLCNLR